MKIRRTFSLCCIFMVLFSNVGYSGHGAIRALHAYHSAGKWLTEHSREGFHEFRKTTKLSVSGTEESSSHEFTYDVCRVSVYAYDTRYFSFLLKYLNKTQSSKLYIDLGALII